MRSWRRVLLVLALATAGAGVMSAQIRVTLGDEWCARDRGERERDRVSHCEVREFSMPVSRSLEVDASPNGGISVEGWDRSEILVRAKVSAWAESEDAATRIAGGITIGMRDGDGGIRSSGPRTGRREGWAVSFQVFVPRAIDLDLRSTNGGIRLQGVRGEIDFRTVNGGVTLDGVGGEVSGRTVNGGLRVALQGSRWDGAGLDVRTTNGGLTILVPEGYSASLETATTNGSLNVDFPVTVQGTLSRRRLALDLGQGGPPIKAVTTNGSVRLQRP